MAELGHRALRELIEGFGGCDEYFSEMISAGAFLDGGPFEKWYAETGPRPEKLVFQVVGSDEETIARAAGELGRLDCAGIDINMGCCAPLIRKAGAGIAWMASADRAGRLVGAARRATGRRLSVKLRIGFDEDFERLAGFCLRLQEEGAELITLHPRLADEKLKRRARWEYVGALRAALRIPVAGNGDVQSAEDLAARAAGPCDAVMSGRGAVRRPWIFAQARAKGGAAYPEPSAAEIEETGLRFLELLSRWQPREFHASRARRFFGFFCDNLKWGTHVKNLLARQESLAGMERAWRAHFAGVEGEA